MTSSSFTDPVQPSLALDVALAPVLISEETAPRERTVYIVVDVIRATTTLCVQLAQGCRRVYVAGSIEAARVAARTLAEERGKRAGQLLLAGEVGGVAPSGFDHGNSPAEFAALDLSDHEIVFATTNGTRALRASAGGAAVLAGSLRNAGAVVHAALTLATRLVRTATTTQNEGAQPGIQRSSQASEALVDEDRGADAAIVMVCSGRGERPAYDDTICAGYLVRQMQRQLERAGAPFVLGNGARIAAATAFAAERQGLRTALAESGAARAIEAVGLGSDLDWCVDVDACANVPVVTGYDSRLDLLVVEPLALETLQRT